MTMPLKSEELSSIYYELGKCGAFARGQNFGCYKGFSLEEVLQVALEASRWDINLLYILVDFLAFHLRKIRLFYFRELIGKSKTPQTLAIALEFAKKLNKSPEFNEFYHFMIKKIKPVKTFRLYNLGRLFIIENLREDALCSLREYKKWGFLCKELPILKHHKIKKKNTLSKNQRIDILAKLFNNKREIKLSDYMEGVGNSVTRQQAHRDILNFKNVKWDGEKRGRRYFIK